MEMVLYFGGNGRGRKGGRLDISCGLLRAVPRARRIRDIFAPSLHRIGAVTGTQGVRIGRIALATIAGELTPILLLVIVVLMYETTGVDAQTRQAFAERVGMWLGPIAGAISTFGFGFLAARDTHRPRLHGTLVGVAVALLDAGIIFASGAKFIPLFAASWAGKILAGVVAGRLAARR
jgi:hypothetical protein